MTLEEFLLERIAEDEDVASSRWSVSMDDCPWPEITMKGSQGTERLSSAGDDITEECREWAMANRTKRPEDVRMLAECQAKRRIVDLSDSADPDGADAAYDAMLAVAQVYADHPDFRPEGRWQL